MKRIAILLAAVGMGSGCVVSSTPCDSRTLTVDWLFVDVVGNANLLCSDVGVNNVDVYVDGTRVAMAEPCTNYGISRSGFSAGPHDIVVEGFNGSTLVNRDLYTVNAADCGDTTFHASPGEGQIDISPSSCHSPQPTYLLYRLADVTHGTPGVVISSVVPTSLTYPYTCGGGISFPVPYGLYDLEQIEEINGTDTVTYASKCSATAADVLHSNLNTTIVAFTGAGACTW
jgi:hypothetical protein